MKPEVVCDEICVDDFLVFESYTYICSNVKWKNNFMDPRNSRNILPLCSFV